MIYFMLVRSLCTCMLVPLVVHLHNLCYDIKGQALVKINIGAVFDCNGDWTGALNAYEEGYR